MPVSCLNASSRTTHARSCVYPRWPVYLPNRCILPLSSLCRPDLHRPTIKTSFRPSKGQASSTSCIVSIHHHPPLTSCPRCLQTAHRYGNSPLVLFTVTLASKRLALSLSLYHHTCFGLCTLHFAPRLHMLYTHPTSHYIIQIALAIMRTMAVRNRGLPMAFGKHVTRARAW